MSKKIVYLIVFVVLLGTVTGALAFDYSPFISDEFILHWPDPTRAYPDIPLDFRFVAYEIHNSPLTWELIGQPAGMTIDQDGNVDWTPTAGDIGSYNITVKVTREAGGFIQRAFTLSVNTTDFIFVSTTGSDSTGDGSLGSPYGTIEHAMRQISNGDGKTIYIRGGTYHEAYAWEAAGIISPLRAKDFSAADPVEIRSYPGESAILDSDLSGHGLWYYDTSYVIFSNLDAREASNRGGGLFTSASQHVMIRDSVVRECHWAASNNCTGYMVQGADDVIFDRCEGYNNDDPGNSHWNSSNFLIYTESGSSSNIYIQNCLSEDSISGFKIKHAGPKKLIVHNCRSVNDKYAFAGASDFSSFRYSVAYGSGLGTGVHLGMTDPNPYTDGAMLVEHMTVANARTTGLRIQDTYLDSGSVIQYNIFYNDIAAADTYSDPHDRLYAIWNYQPSGPVITSDKNVFYSPSANNIVRYGPGNYSFSSWQGAGYDANSVFDDPLFTDLANGDFGVEVNSPANLGSGEFAGAYIPGAADPQPPGQAGSPSPANSATGVSIDANLHWSAGLVADSHDVYFGTSLNDIANGTRPRGDVDGSAIVDWNDVLLLHEQWLTDPTGLYPCADLNGDDDVHFADFAVIGAGWRQEADSTFMSNQTQTTFDPGMMSYETTYYWRIDENNAVGKTKGNVWSFVTEAIPNPPGLTTNPSPADTATYVSTTADLSWDAGAEATSYDVYFGTISPGASQGNQTETTFDPGTMPLDTTHYWRIDSVNSLATTTGTVWSFTTESLPQPASNPSPADSATDVSVAADLSWTPGDGATSHDVYFGTSNPGDFQGNQLSATFDPGTLDFGTTYYCRIDEINANGTTTGTVWSFTTAAAGDAVTEEFGDALGTDHSGTVADTFTNAGDPGSNKSTLTELWTYTWPADTIANTTIIKWDLSAIPTDATIVDATLYLYQIHSGLAGGPFYDIGVHKIINVDPVISALTWATYDGVNSWTGGANGGQSDIAAAEATQAVNKIDNVYKVWTITNMVADWVATPASNYGMLVNSDDVALVDSHRTFASTEDGDASVRPKLVVAYISAE